MDPEDSGRASPEPMDEDEVDGSSGSQDEEAEAGFEGDTLQTAQDKIMSELTRLKDSE